MNFRFHVLPGSIPAKAVVMMALLGLLGLPGLFGQQGTPGEIVKVIISFQQTPGATEQALVRAFGGDIEYSFTIVPAIAASIPQAALNGLQNHPLVTVIEEDGTFQEVGEYDLWGLTKIQAKAAHDNGARGNNVKVAVIDSGVDCQHPDLSANCTITGWDFVENDADPNDESGHGTHVAGTIGAVINSAGVVGVAPEVQIVPLRVLDASGSGSFSDVIAALQWIQNYNSDNPAAPIRVTNNSYGSSRDPGSAVMGAFDAIRDSVLHVAASGNATFFSCRKVGFPAAYSSVVAVGATDSSDNWASFSCYGNELELSAPGVGILSTMPTESCTLCGTYGNDFGTLSGTSMASPHAAGVAALVVGADPQISVTDVRQRLRTTAVDVNATGWDKYTGYGRVDALAASNILPSDQPPMVTIVNPIDGTTVSGASVSIQIDASDTEDAEGTLSVQWSIDGGNWQDAFSDGGTNYSATWSLGGVSDGAHTVNARATDSGSNTVSDANSVTVNNVNDQPVATFTFSCTGLSCSFDASGSDDPDGSIVSYTWIFGDGETATGVNAAHSFVSAGTYNVQLTVTDNEGAQGTNSRAVTVSEPSGIVLEVSGRKIKGTKYADLTWYGTTSGQVDIWRDGSFRFTEADDGAFTDDTLGKGGGSYVYQVCEAGTNTCSSEVTVTF